MTTHVSRPQSALLYILSICIGMGVAATHAQGAKSAPLAKQVTQIMVEKQMQYVAAKDASGADTYVAALHIAGLGLLVVSGKYAVPVLLNERLGQKNYSDVYGDLQGASVAGSKVFVNDLGGDGLVARPDDNQPSDTYDTGTTVTFNGDWRRQKLSEGDYMKTYQDADSKYEAMLQALLAELKK